MHDGVVVDGAVDAVEVCGGEDFGRGEVGY